MFSEFGYQTLVAPIMWWTGMGQGLSRKLLVLVFRCTDRQKIASKRVDWWLLLSREERVEDCSSIMIGTILYEALCYGNIIAIPYSYQYYGWLGVFVLTSTLHPLAICLDFIRSPTARTNIDRIAKVYKVSRWMIYCLMAVNLICANVLVVSILVCFDAIEASLPAPLNASTILRLVASLASYWIISEITFTSGHIWLHRTAIGGRIHRLHHLCKPASWSTNLLFHPLDLLVEFGGPFLVMPLMHMFFIRDPFVFRTAIILLYIWYAADHSETLGLSHGTHHSSSGSRVLTIYGRYHWFERFMNGSSYTRRVQSWDAVAPPVNKLFKQE